MRTKMKVIHSHRILLATCTIGIVSLLISLPTLRNEFVFDDLPAIVDNRDIRPEQTPLTRIFHNDYWGTPIHKEESHKSYRPLTILTFRWNYMLHGLQVTGYHLVNNILHSIVSILFFRLCLCYTRNFMESFISSLYFTIHPIHVDAVASIVGRAELLSALFSLSALLYHCTHKTDGDYFIINHLNPSEAGNQADGVEEEENPKYHQNNNDNNSDKSILIVFLLTLVGTFCKEQASTTLIVCIYFEALFRYNLRSKIHSFCKHWFNRIANGRIFSHSPTSKFQNRVASKNDKIVFFSSKIFYLSVGFLFIVCLRFAIMNNRLPTFNRLDNPARTLPAPYRQLNYAYLWAYNGWLLIYPFHLSCDWTSSSLKLITSLFDIHNFYTLFFLIALFLLLLESDTTTLMGLGLSMITFLPVSNALFPMGFVIAERVLYLPSMGFSILFARGFTLLHQSIKAKCKRWTRIGFYLLTVICLASLTIKTINRCYEWRNEITLFTSGLEVNPMNVKLLNNVGRLHESQGDLNLALEFYGRAIAIEPTDARGYLNSGKTLTKLGLIPEAETFYRKAFELLPQSTERRTSSASTVSFHSTSTSEATSSLLSSTYSTHDDSHGDHESSSTTPLVMLDGALGKLTFSNYERLVNQGTSTEPQKEINLIDPIEPISISLFPPATYIENNFSTSQITLYHLQGLLDYASLLSTDQTRLNEANSIFQRIASIKPDYPLTYSTWIQSIISSSSPPFPSPAPKLNSNIHHHKPSASPHRHPDHHGKFTGETLLNQFISNNKQTDPAILYNMAILSYNNGDIGNALNLFDQILEMNPFHEETLLTSARMIKDNELNEHLPTALERLRMLISLGSNDETIYFDLGMISIRLGFMANARGYFAKAIELKPNFTEALFNMALLLYKEERPEEALPFLQYLLQIEESHGKASLLMFAINSGIKERVDQRADSLQRLSSSSSSSSHETTKPFPGSESNSISFLT